MLRTFQTLSFKTHTTASPARLQQLMFRLCCPLSVNRVFPDWSSRLKPKADWLKLPFPLCTPASATMFVPVRPPSLLAVWLPWLPFPLPNLPLHTPLSCPCLYAAATPQTAPKASHPESTPTPEPHPGYRGYRRFRKMFAPALSSSTNQYHRKEEHGSSAESSLPLTKRIFVRFIDVNDSGLLSISAIQLYQ